MSYSALLLVACGFSEDLVIDPVAEVVGVVDIVGQQVFRFFAYGDLLPVMEDVGVGTFEFGGGVGGGLGVAFHLVGSVFPVWVWGEG
ncbi:MAG: hypothetical protein RI897_1478 [Verrucomicrobiota bacterium]